MKSSIGASVKNPNQLYHTHLKNISKGGAFLHSFSQNDHHIGQNILVTLPGKNQRKVKLVSKIVWMDDAGIGVKFLRHHNKPAR